MPYTPIVKELVDYYYNPENIAFKEQFQQAFDLVLLTGLKIFTDYNINTVDEYFDYMDKFVHWIPSEDTNGTNVYYHIAVFYFILDQNPIVQQQNPIDPSTGTQAGTTESPYHWLTGWLICYAKEMGRWMDTPASITKASIDSFKKAPSYRMNDYDEPTGSWKTFNEFFARQLKSGQRPIADDTKEYFVIVSPADCAYEGNWTIDDKANVTTFPVKGVPWCINQLLQDTKHCPDFAGGVFTHSFLTPTDYHRQHAPVSGTVIEAKVIPGICYLGVTLVKGTGNTGESPAIQMQQMQPSASNGEQISWTNTAGYQFLQARALILIEHEHLGRVAVLPIGMAQVSSVKLLVKTGDTVKKGQEISYFQLGGSDVVMVFQKKANIKFEQDMKVGQHNKVGVKVATAPKPKQHN